MIKLLKYDLRRNGNLLLGGIAILILSELVLLWSGAVIEAKIGLSVLFFAAAAVVLAISSLKVFDYNITSISRRLVPVNTLSYVWASLLYGLLNTAVLTLLGAAVGAYFFVKFGNGLTEVVYHIPVGLVALIILEYIFIMVYGFLTFYVTIASARSIASKGVFWIGLVIFMVLTCVVSWLESLLFAQDSTQLFSAVAFHVDARTGVLSRDLSGFGVTWNTIGTLLFEVLLCVIYLFVIKWCVEKKIGAR